jgi:hypothetical protein
MLEKILVRPLVIVALTLFIAGGSFALAAPVAWAGTATETKPIITVTPATVLPNQSVAVTGTGFSDGGRATISTITIGGVVVPSVKINFGEPVTIDDGGKFVANLVTPVNSTTLKSGSHKMEVTDSGGVKGSVSITVSKPAISAAPASSRAGSTITVTGSNFPIDSSSIGADVVPVITLEYEVRVNDFQRVATVLPDTTGRFTSAFILPSNVRVPSEKNEIRASLQDFSAEITTTHSVLGPTIVLKPDKGAPGTIVTVQGSNFIAFAAVQSLSVGNLEAAISPALHTDEEGRFTTTFAVPEMDSGTQPFY